MKISVILPVHNEHEYLFSALDSVLNQKFDEYELIVIVNGGNEKLFNTIRSYSNRIVVLKTDIKYLPFALNMGISASKSDLIVRMDSDDVCEENRLAEIWSFMNENLDIHVVSSYMTEINESGVALSILNKFPIDNKSIRFFLPFRCVVPHPTIAFRKSQIEMVGGYMFGHFSEDYDLWLRLRRNKLVKFATIPKSLVNYRVHNQQVTNSANAWSIFSYDVSLKVREFLFTGDFIFFVGLIFTIFDGIYKRTRLCLRKYIKRVN